MDETIERVTLAKVTRRLIPFMFLLYVCNYLDRVNVSIAALTMKQDLHFSDTVYGFGAGIFFLGYFLFEVPSNLILERVGARRWIARIMISWGITSSCMMFIHSAFLFYLLRFLLGLAEAGFFPGMVIYLTYWFPSHIRARSAARFMVAGTVAGIIGGPLGSIFLKMDGIAGLKGWQWLFLLEGVPSFLLGFVVLFYLTDRPSVATWLSPTERDWLTERIEKEQAHRQKHQRLSLLQGLAHKKVLHLSLMFILMQICGYGLGLWSPQILKFRSNWSDAKVLWLGALPSIVGAIAMILAAANSDRTRERRMHLVVGLWIEIIGIVMAASVRSPELTLVAFTVIALGGGIANGPFWALCTSFLSGTAAAGGIALINSIGNSGGFFGPYLMGVLKSSTSSYEAGILVLAGIMFLASLLGFVFRHDLELEHGATVPEAAKPTPS